MKIFNTLFFSVYLLTMPLLASENSLTLFVYPPQKELNWNSPKTVLNDFLGITVLKSLFPGQTIEASNPDGETSEINQYYKSTMGHTIAHVSCTDSNGEKYDTWSSFSGQDFAEVDKKNIFVDKIGLGVLFYDYFDGHIIQGEENIKRLVYYRAAKRDGEKTRPRYLQVPVDAAKCDALKDFVTFFEGFKHKKEISVEELMALPDESKLYFTTNIDPYESYLARKVDPKARVGGGCAPYGVALLKVIGKYDYYFDYIWKLNIVVSENKLGKTNPVNILNVILGSLGNHWADKGYPTRTMSQYDPDLMWKFIGDVIKCQENNAKNCSIPVTPWFAKNSGRAEKGETIKLSDTRKIVWTETDEETNQDVEKEVLKTRTQEIEGIILHK